jgi:cytoskeletal protein CcmA (bactofilin family)
VSGAVDLEIHGRVDGEVAVGGDTTIEAEGLVASHVSARRVVVRGAVKGDLTGEESVVLENGARVVGDIRAPRISIAKGALVRGHVQTGDAPAAPQRARAQASASRAGESPRSAVKPATKAVVTSVPKSPAPRPQARAEVVATHPSVLAGSPPPKRAEAPRSPHTAGAAKPPAPVVPVLKKGARGALKKKAG